MASVPEDRALELADLQSSRLDVNHNEEDLEVCGDDDLNTHNPAAAVPECFADQSVYTKPSAYIWDLVSKLPTNEQLTRDQTLFLVRFAKACDEAWEHENKPPSQRKVHHLLLLGQGGSGKTHVVQRWVFKAVQYI